MKPGIPAGLPCIHLPLADADAQKSYPAWEAITAKTEPLKGEPVRPKFLGGPELDEPPVPKGFKEPPAGAGRRDHQHERVLGRLDGRRGGRRRRRPRPFSPPVPGASARPLPSA